MRKEEMSQFRLDSKTESVTADTLLLWHAIWLSQAMLVCFQIILLFYKLIHLFFQTQISLSSLTLSLSLSLTLSLSHSLTLSLSLSLSLSTREGEALRPIASSRMVTASYLISAAYCVGDVAYVGYQERKKSIEMEERGEKGSDWKPIVYERSIFQFFGSLLLPAIVISTQVSKYGECDGE
jgi:hypothetical protein